MRYPESKEQTAIVLRQALILMSQHDAALNPLTFAVFYEHAAGVNRRLSEALDKALATTPRLSDTAVRALHRDFVAEVGIDEAERIRGDMYRVMTGIAESAARTGQAAGSFGDRLDGLSSALTNPDPAAITARLSETIEGTRRMRESVEDLQRQVASSSCEIEQLRADLLRTREESMQCPLTRVLNRRGFDDRLNAMLGVPPPKGSAHCLILLDIDHFKRVNDTHGHVIGDRVIEGMGTVLRSMPAEPGMSCARYGGEEFAILLPATTLSRATQVAETVLQRTRGIRLRERSTQQVKLAITVSAGVAAWHPGEAARDFVSCADAALYRSKQNGRDRVTVA
jgi:diguanylate cyclase